MSSCDVCHKNPSVGVGASTCGAISFAYCKECLSLGAEPYGALVAYLSSAVNKGEDCKPEAEQIQKGYQGIIDGSLSVAGKTREEFYADVDKCITEMNEFYSQM
jgi:hypothetical protein